MSADPMHGNARHDLRVAVALLRGGVREVAQHREVQIPLTVGEELHLEVLERISHRLHIAEEGGHDHDAA